MFLRIISYDIHYTDYFLEIQLSILRVGTLFWTLTKPSYYRKFGILRQCVHLNRIIDWVIYF